MPVISVCWFFYAANLLKLLISSNTFLADSLGCSIYKIALANTHNFTFSFPICMSFISLSCLIDLPSTSSTILNRNVKSGHHFLVPDLTGKALNFFPLSMFAGLVVYGLYYADVSSIPYILRILYWKEAVFYQMLFWHILIWSCDFYFSCYYVIYYIYWFAYVELSLYSRDKSQLVLVYNSFNMFLNSVC